ncbi:uncharacterized protein HHUB_4278 (plasmid) [Halobacterium hubeiense]|uniref:Amphi-Trp domain-containing protein n=1 Tax=Halobacterium hubeiense TaxID=1407499 RepID=A0A0U5H7I7_9EURY|nr:amphi-Trp domain-containing protein [Halobacterium hubeiense]CQH64103.1 uncharacterized protein HHUB_4278 [Halobacterium hubeiense]
MPEETIFRVSSRRTQDDIADSLRTLAEKLETGEDVTLSTDDESTTVTVPDEPRFEVEVEQEIPSSGGQTETSIEVEVEWKEGADSFTIE